jgi:predicted dehydrogenase
VGLGYWGPNLVRNFASLPDVELAWVCDIDDKRLATIARSFRVTKTTTRFAEILEDSEVDAVALATPVATHRPLGEAALRAGKHVWIEKPLAGSAEDAEALVAVARKHDRRLMVDHTFVYTPAVRKIRQLVQEGTLGDILYFDSVRVNLGLFQNDTNVLWDLGPHDFSIAQYVLDRKPQQVSAIAVRHVAGATENMAYVTLRYAGNLVAHFHLNWLAPIKVRMTMIGGSRRMVVYNELEPVEKVKVYDRGIDVHHPQTDEEERRRTLFQYRSGDLWSPMVEYVEPLSSAAKDFVSAIREHRAPLVDGEAGLQIVRVLAAAQRSLEADGKFVDIPA